MTDSNHQGDRPATRHATRSSSPTASTWSACSAPATSTSASSSGASTPTSTCAATGSRCSGEPGEVALAERLLDELVTIIRTGQGVTGRDRRAGARDAARRDHRAPGRRAEPQHPVSNRGRSIRPKTLNQKRYVDSIDKHTITFGIGPAGTGKTYLAMAKAVQALQSKNVNRIILTRPGGRGGRAARLPARHAQREDRPLPAPALRRAARHDRPRDDPQAAGRRHHRGRAAGLHARPLAQRLLHHPRRGAEHLARADEDVPDPARASAPRSWSPATSPRSTCPAARSPACGSSRASSTASRTSRSTGSPPTTSSGTGWSARSSRRTTSSTPATSCVQRQRDPRSDAS